MASPLWHARRIDTRTLKHIDPHQIADWLQEAGGDEDDDDFRVRVRGLPRKTSRDSIIKRETVQAALARGKDFDKAQLTVFPVILSCDPAWTGGDETTIWYRQGNYVELLEKYKLDKSLGENHKLTYDKLCYWETQLGADAVHVDQGEGTAVITLAHMAEKYHWVLVSFAGSPNDTLESKESQYANIRAQMYYETAKFLTSAAIGLRDPKWKDEVEAQLCWTKGGRHKVTQKKTCEPKSDIKDRVGRSPDVADGLVLLQAHKVLERLPENLTESHGGVRMIGGSSYQMPDHDNPYETLEADYERLYD